MTTSAVAPATRTGQSWASSPAVRASMQGNRSRDTGPEVALRRALHGRGCGIAWINGPSPTSTAGPIWSFGEPV